MLGKRCRLGVAGAPQAIRILLINANARVDCRIDADDPALLVLANEHIGDDRARFESGSFGARARIKPANKLEGGVQLYVGAT